MEQLSMTNLIVEEKEKSDLAISPPASDTPPSQSAARTAAPSPVFDASKAICNYSNFCRVIGTPEEVVLDLGLNENPTITPTTPVVVTQRVVLNYYTAKRLLHALQLTLQRHEAVFGAIEVDIQRRLTPRARGD
jgi:hypothetical protein